MLKRLTSLARLSAREQWFALRALGTLAGVRVALRLLPFGRLRALIDHVAGAAPVPPAPPDPGVARAVRRAVNRAARTIPGSVCLAQALTAELLLRRDGQATRVSIGVALDGKPLAAHAWVESAGVLVTGDIEDMGTYRTLAVFGGDARPGRAP